MPSKNFSATITIGGAIGSSFKAAVGGVAGGIKEIGKAVKDLKSTSSKVDAFNPKKVMELGRAFSDAKRRAGELGEQVKNGTAPSVLASGAAYTEARRRAIEFAKELRKTQGPGGVSEQQTAELERLRRASDRAKREFESSKKSVAKESERARVSSLRAQKAFETERQSQHKLRDELRGLGVDTRRIADEKKRLEAQAEKLGRRMRALATIAKSDVGGAFSRLTSVVRTGVFTIGGAVAGVGAAIFGLAKTTSDSGDKIAKTSQYLGISADALQEFRYAGELSGVAAEEMDAALEKLTIRVGDTIDPASDLGRAIRRVGLSVQELRTLGADEAMFRIADGIEAIEDPTIRAQTVVQLFGKSAINMVNVLKDGSGELAKMRKEAHETGNVMGKEALENSEKFNDAFYRAKQSVIGAKNAIGSALLPVVIDLANEFRDFVVGNGDSIREWAKGFAEDFRKSVPDIIAVGRTFIDVSKSIGSAAGSVASIFGWLKIAAIGFSTILAGKAVVALVSLGATLFEVGSAVAALVLTLNPVTLAIIGIGAAIVGAAALVWKYWTPIGEFFSRLGDKIGGVMNKLGIFNSGSNTTTSPGSTMFSNSGAAWGGRNPTLPQPDIDAEALRKSTGSAAPQVTQNIPITINAMPGQSADDIARSVSREMQQRQSAVARGALYDTVSP